MRDRIKASNLTTLYICPSDDFGTIERRALRDCSYFRDIGSNIALYCQKDSRLAKEAEDLDIPIIYYSGKKIKRIWDYTFYQDIRTMLKEGRYDIIHCYKMDYIWILAICLFTNSKIPLILSDNRLYQEKSGGLLHKWISRRIDLMLVFSESNKDTAGHFLPVSSRKIKMIGGGIEVGKKRAHDEPGKRILGTIISYNTGLMDKVETILHAIPYLILKTYDLAMQLEFVIYCDTPWVTVRDFPKIQDLIERLGIAEVVKFEYLRESPDQIIQSFSLYIGIDFEEPFNDYEIMALLYFIPTVFPRLAPRQELLASGKRIGETYYPGDSRELKDKLLKILLNEQSYITEIQEFHETLSNIHGIENYCEKLVDLYETNFIKRLRISEKMGKSAAWPQS